MPKIPIALPWSETLLELGGLELIWDLGFGIWNLPSHQLLHAIVLRVRDAKISLRIERDAPRIVELARLAAGAANHFQWMILGVEDLDAAVAELTDVLA